MPRPRSDLSEMRPPISWMLLRTTSMPTPRPEISEIFSAVENPGNMIRLLISSSLRLASGLTRPFSFAFLSTRSELMPAPSSLTSMTMRPPRCSAESRIVPSSLFTRRQPIRRQFDAVVDRIADDMRQRIAQPLDDRAIHFGGLTDHFQPHFFLGLGRKLAHEPRHALEHRTDRLRAHRHDAVLQLARVVNDLFENLRQSPARSLRKILHDLPQHRLRNHQFAHHVHDAVDTFELDPGRGGGRPGRAWIARRSPSLPASAGGAAGSAFAAGASGGATRSIGWFRPAASAAGRFGDRPVPAATDGAATGSTISSSQSPITNLEDLIDLRARRLGAQRARPPNIRMVRFELRQRRKRVGLANRSSSPSLRSSRRM